MATFGLFDGKLKESHQEFEGDHLIISGEIVSIMGKDDEGTNALLQPSGWLRVRALRKSKVNLSSPFYQCRIKPGRFQR